MQIFALCSVLLTSPQPTGDNHHRCAPQQQQFKDTPQMHLQWAFPSPGDDLAQLQEDRDHLYHTHVLICSFLLSWLFFPHTQPNESAISTWISLLCLVLVQSIHRDKNPAPHSPAPSSVPEVLQRRPMVVWSRREKWWWRCDGEMSTEQ